jgi:adenylate kinase family enzyme
MLHRIHVVGAAGSGKTYLAAALAAALAADHYELDRVAMRRCGDEMQVTLVPWPERCAAAAEIAERPRWVTEGIYLGWTEPLFAAADLIVWLDIPWWQATWRITARHARKSLRGENEWKGIRLLLRFLWSTRRYYLGPGGNPNREHDDGATDRRMTAAALAPYSDKVIRFRSGRNIVSSISRDAA